MIVGENRASPCAASLVVISWVLTSYTRSMIEFSSEALVLSDDLSVNAILWVSSLPEDELGPSKRILEDLNSLRLSNGFEVFEFSVSDRKGFFR